MYNNKEQFVEQYKKTIDTEFSIFCAEASKYSYEQEKQNPVIAERLNNEVNELKKSYNKDKLTLSSIQLSPKEAKEIISQSTKDNFNFMADGIQGSDCYRFMNNGIKNNADVAHEAFKQDKSIAKHFPYSLKERMDGNPVEKALPAMAFATQIQSQINNKHSQVKQKQSHSFGGMAFA